LLKQNFAWAFSVNKAEQEVNDSKSLAHEKAQIAVQASEPLV